MWPKVEAWDHWVRTLAEIAKRQPQPAYSGLVMSIQLEWQYLQRTVPGVGNMMGTIEDTLIEALFPELFGGEEVSADLREVLGYSVKRGGLGISDSRMLVEHVYNNSKADSEVRVGSLLGVNNLNYVVHKNCVPRSSTDARKQQEYLEKQVLTRRK